jgi:hypothetical protein
MDPVVGGTSGSALFQYARARLDEAMDHAEVLPDTLEQLRYPKPRLRGRSPRRQHHADSCVV